MNYTYPLFADGIHDDTAALNERLAEGGLVTVPRGTYLISNTLFIPDNTCLRLEMGAVIRLADDACCLMLRNKGSKNMTVEGGVWDGNNATQRRGKLFPDKPYCMGVVMLFDGAVDVTIRDLTVKDPESYAMQLLNVDRFTVENITFDYNFLRPNMDGVHVQGPARNGYIRNIKGATNDDMVALNCDDRYDDGEERTVSMGDIENVTVDGIFADNGYTGVRLLSCGSRMRNITVRNVFGTYRFYGVSFTHHNVVSGAPVWFDGITLDNIHASKHPQTEPLDLRPIECINKTYGDGMHDYAVTKEPIIWFAEGVTCGNVTLSNIHRIEEAVTEAPTVRIDTGVRIERLVMHNVTQRFVNCPEVPLLDKQGEVTELIRT